MNLQERAQLQIAKREMENTLSEKKQQLFSSEIYLNASFLEQIEMLDEFVENHSVEYEEINQLNNQLIDFLEISYNQDDDGCLNCGS